MTDNMLPSCASNEQLIAECVRRKLISSSSAVRILRRSIRNLQVEADLWIMEHPELFSIMEKAASRFVKHRKRFGAKLIAEQVRWSNKGDKGSSQFKLDNCIVPYIARRMIERNQKLIPYIRTRRTSS